MSSSTETVTTYRKVCDKCGKEVVEVREGSHEQPLFKGWGWLGNYTVSGRADICPECYVNVLAFVKPTEPA